MISVYRELAGSGAVLGVEAAGVEVIAQLMSRPHPVSVQIETEACEELRTLLALDVRA